MKTKIFAIILILATTACSKSSDTPAAATPPPPAPPEVMTAVTDITSCSGQPDVRDVIYGVWRSSMKGEHTSKDSELTITPVGIQLAVTCHNVNEDVQAIVQASVKLDGTRLNLLEDVLPVTETGKKGSTCTAAIERVGTLYVYLSGKCLVLTTSVDQLYWVR